MFGENRKVSQYWRGSDVDLSPGAEVLPFFDQDLEDQINISPEEDQNICLFYLWNFASKWLLVWTVMNSYKPWSTSPKKWSASSVNQLQHFPIIPQPTKQPKCSYKSNKKKRAGIQPNKHPHSKIQQLSHNLVPLTHARPLQPASTAPKICMNCEPQHSAFFQTTSGGWYTYTLVL